MELKNVMEVLKLLGSHSEEPFCVKAVIEKEVRIKNIETLHSSIPFEEEQMFIKEDDIPEYSKRLDSLPISYIINTSSDFYPFFEIHYMETYELVGELKKIGA